MRFFLRFAGAALLVIAVVIGVWTAAGLYGWQSGEEVRATETADKQATDVAQQVTLAEEDITAENYTLALRRAEWVLTRQPLNESALAIQGEVQQRLNITPTFTPLPSATPTATPLVTATPAEIGIGEEEEGDPAGELQQVQQLVNDQSWAEALSAILTFQHTYPAYERRQTDELLFEIYIERGLELMPTEQVEVGLYYLQQAQTLGTLPQEASDNIIWAQMYLDGVSYYGIKWEVTHFYFRDLCTVAPNFHDACDQYYEVTLLYADSMASAQEWCLAQTLYAEAYQQQQSTTIANSLADARVQCAALTP